MKRRSNKRNLRASKPRTTDFYCRASKKRHRKKYTKAANSLKKEHKNHRLEVSGETEFLAELSQVDLSTAIQGKNHVT